ncbi:MAG: alanine racemase [Proteobacteria bacterium]|nr:alanine racemase [Pseudomonadota bacterium]
MKLSDLKTPALVLDRARLERNVAAMSRRMKAHGVDLRPHMKTAKSAEVARLATAGHSGGITVSTLAEAAYFVRNGFRDITYAVGIVPAKLDAVAALQNEGARITVMTDNVPVARALAEESSAFDAPLRVLIEVDSGLGRGGVAPEDPALVEIARALAAGPNVEPVGVLTHAGHAYACSSVAGIEAVAEAERTAAVAAAGRLRDAGHRCPVVSVGSTPTALFGRSFEGVTEARPGVYVFFDLFQAGLGCCTADDIAISVLASVIGHRPGHGRLLIDAGSLALSQDRSTQSQPEDAGYGLVFDVSGRRRIADLRVARVNQEHGFVEAAGGAVPFDELPIGARVRVMPNHACMTAAAYDRYDVVDGGDEVVAVWDRVNRW